MNGKMTPEQRDAQEALTEALRTVLDDGRAVPCMGNGSWWDSPLGDDIAQASAACKLCPVFDACNAAGQYETWGTFAGVWRGPAQKREKAS